MGNVLSIFDAYNQKTEYEYWPNNEKKYERKFDQFGVLISEVYYEVDPDTLDITLINDNGRITKYDYQYHSDGSKTETITDPELKVYVNHYDPAGNIYRIEFPADENGLVKEAGSQINAKGLVDWTMNSEQEKTIFTYYSGGKDDGRKKTEKDPEGNITTFTYDDNGNIASESTTVTINGVPTTVLTQYFYDLQNRLVKTIHPDKSITKTFYDDAGNLDYEIDKLQRKTDYQYNMYGKLEEILYPDGTKESKTYDAEGNLKSETDRQSRTTWYEYDKLNRLTITRYFDNSYTEVQYDALGNVEFEWDENRNKTTYKYDISGRLEYVEDAKGQRHLYSYDANNNLKAETDKNQHTTIYHYNALGQKTGTELADKQWLKQSFDTLGRKLSSEDQEGKVTRYGYDQLGRLETVTQTLNAQDLITKYTYDETGNKLTQEDAMQRITKWSYDILGRVKTRTLPELMSESFDYDVMGNVEFHTDFNNKTTRYTYHPLNDRLERVDYEDGNFEQYTYYDAGQVKTITTAAGTVTYEYDLRDRLKLETKANGDSITYDYDPVGNRTSVTTTINGISNITTYHYNQLNQLEQVKVGEQVITSYTYDFAGNLKTTTAENGVVTTYHYDTVNRLDDMNIKDAQGNLLESYDYVLRHSGRRAQVIEHNGRTVVYDYDDLYRLTSETVTDAVNGNYSATYTYDDVGNRKSSTINGITTAYDYDLNDRLKSQGGTVYSYDDNGNTLTESIDNDLTTYTYNDKNELIATEKLVAGVTTNRSYSYNADGVRTSQIIAGVETKYFIDSNRDYAQVLMELDSSNNPQVKYQYGLDLISQERAGIVNNYHYDGLGSTRLLSDATGVVTDTYHYEAFGEVLSSTGMTENNYLFTGEQFDTGLDQYYLRARFYDQSVGRFTQMDTWMGHNSDPITLNKYLYANADPILYTDPTGMFGLMSFSIANNIRTTLSEIQIDTGFNILDSAVGGGESLSRPSPINMGIAAIGGAGAFKLMKLLSGKFRKACNSFTEDTLVSTEFGLKRITEIKIGDKVWAFNEQTGEKSLQKVVHLIHGEGDKEIVDITLMSGKLIQATSGHPFYVSNSASEWSWLDAGDLSTGSILTNLNGDELQVASVVKYSKQLSVYNITVDKDHTYFVGEEEVLNHNAGKTCNFKGVVWGAEKPTLYKHTKHQRGGPKGGKLAGLEPDDSFIAMQKTGIKSAKDGNWYARSTDGKSIYRYFPGGQNSKQFHWSGSTGDARAPLNKAVIPPDIIKALGFKVKGSKL